MHSEHNSYLESKQGQSAAIDHKSQEKWKLLLFSQGTRSSMSSNTIVMMYNEYRYILQVKESLICALMNHYVIKR